MNLKLKNTILISVLIILCMVTLSCVSAESITDGDLLQNSTGEPGDEVTQTPVEKFMSDIDNASSGNTIYLTEDIAINDTIYINKDITIDGQNHAIDAQEKCGILYSNSKLTLKNLIFKNGETVGSGGAIYARGELIIDNCQFINNKAYDGGAIDFYGTSLTITNSKFSKNTASDSGGAVLTHTGSNLIVKNSVFDNNKAIATSHGTRGGAICCFGTSTIASSTFTNNMCKAVASGKTPSKSKQSLGGALYLLCNTHKISDSTFTANSVDNDGGAIFSYSDVSKLTVSKCKFTNNNAYYEDGGAISSCAHNNYITGSTFTGNYAYEDGGAIDTYSYDGARVKVTIDKCTFKSNKAYKSAGAIYMGIKTKYVIKNSNFKANKGTVAGCLYIEPSCSATITKCTFDKNAAANVARKVVYSKSKKVIKHSGGAVYSKSKSTTLSKCTFKSNSATYGGAICNHAKLTVKSSKFSKNSASDSGGAYFHDQGTSILKSNKFVSNKAKKCGGGLYFKKGKMKASKNKFSKNKAKFGNKYYSKKSIKI